MDKKKDKILITELFMGKAGWGRCFHGTIRRETNENGHSIVCSKISMHEGYHYDKVEKEWVRTEKPVITGYIYAMAEDQWELGKNLDDIILMILDFGLHSDNGETTKICNTNFFLN